MLFPRKYLASKLNLTVKLTQAKSIKGELLFFLNLTLKQSAPSLPQRSIPKLSPPPIYPLSYFSPAVINSVISKHTSQKKHLITHFQSPDLQSICLRNIIILFEKPSRSFQKPIYDVAYFHFKESTSACG